ncbi:MAG TPA: hypothetical protein VKN76_14950 [Kiloniellaceae bacterium]|nr:hypothetical protein [Kiloniellaceae bacterium]
MAGFGLGVYILLTVELSFWILAIFGSMALLFLVFGLRTVQRHLSVVALSKEGIACRDFSTKTIYWRDLGQLKLRFYGFRRRAQSDGASFMQLTLKGGGVKITMDSSLERFDLVAWRAVKAAQENAVSLDPSTAGNYLGIGIDADHVGPPPGDPGAHDI